VIWDWSDDQLVALAEYLGERGLTRGAVRAEMIGDGHANLTYLVTDGERKVVVRRPPPPPTPPGANDMLREARVMTALAGTGVPVPEVLAVAQEGELLDVPCYVMTYLPGVVATVETPEHLRTPEDRRDLAFALVDTLAALHAVDWRAQGLEDFGRPEGFNARHVRRMSRLIADEQGELPAAFADVAAWLEAEVPAESGESVIHSDYRLGNIMLGPDRPARVLAILDWELATIGDPLLDLGWLLSSYPEPGEPRTPIQDFGTALLEPGFPTRQEVAARYAEASGRDLAHLQWYVVMALWKSAVLYEHSHRRAVAGVGDPYYADPQLVERFLAACRRTVGLSPTPSTSS
jgi:aminoglycoside phosphotransferase (APT) family kinase protein